MKKPEKGLSAGRLTMMALGSVIGGSFFLGSSVGIHAAGPAVLLSFVLGGVLAYFILYALSEMTVANPDSGSFRTFAAQSLGQGSGFVVGWVYWTGMVLAMSSEATAVSILLREWFPDFPLFLMGSLIIIGVTLMNLLGADRLSKLESGLAAVKLLALISFIVIGVLLIIGLLPSHRLIGMGELKHEAFFPSGMKGVAGSMLIVMLAYSGFEIIGLAASETENPKKTVPRAINSTILSLVGLYIVTAAVLLPLVPTAEVNENASPMVAALNRYGMSWAGTALNVVLITAILSTMLASMFGQGRMMRSLADEGLAPIWLKDKTDVPYRGILSTGAAMLLGLSFGQLFPKIYLFLVSAGGFSILFTYAMIMATHIRFRKCNGCPPDGKCQMWGFPYTSLIVLVSIILIMISMPFVPGQESGLIAGISIVLFFTLCYFAVRHFRRKRTKENKSSLNTDPN